jgi:hypothetical protein
MAGRGSVRRTVTRERFGLWEWRLGDQRNDGHRNLCALLFQRGLPVVEQFTSPRAWAFVLLAMQEYLRSFSGDRMVNQCVTAHHATARVVSS